MTAAEFIGRRKYFMNLIIKNIPLSRERINIALACKAFNNLCNSEESRVDNFKYFIPTIYVLQDTTVPLYINAKEALVINFNAYNILSQTDIQLLLDQIHVKRFELKSLVIKNIQYEYIFFLNESKCFENIEILYFNSRLNYTLLLTMFKEWPSLQPQKLVFFGPFNDESNVRTLNNFTFHNVEFTFPRSIKNIYLVGKTYDVSWIGNMLKGVDDHQLDYLILDELFLTNLYENDLYSVAINLHFFKRV